MPFAGPRDAVSYLTVGEMVSALPQDFRRYLCGVGCHNEHLVGAPHDFASMYKGSDPRSMVFRLLFRMVQKSPVTVLGDKINVGN